MTTAAQKRAQRKFALMAKKRAKEARKKKIKRLEAELRRLKRRK